MGMLLCTLSVSGASHTLAVHTATMAAGLDIKSISDLLAQQLQEEVSCTGDEWSM